MGKKKSRSFLLMSLISASLLVSVFTIVQAQSPAAPAARATNWSDPATWPNRKAPVAGDKVTIDAGKEVVLNVNTPPLNVRFSPAMTRTMYSSSKASDPNASKIPTK